MASPSSSEGTASSQYEQYLQKNNLEWYIEHDCMRKSMKDLVISLEPSQTEDILRREREKTEEFAKRIKLEGPLPLDIPERDTPLRCVLIGKTGSGKSSLGNLLLEKESFKASNKAVSETKCIQHQISKDKVVHVIDTPGFGDPDDTVDAEFEVSKIFNIFLEGVNCFVYVHNMAGGRITEQDLEIFQKMKDIFGEKFRSHAVLVFTHARSHFKPEEHNTLLEYLDSFEDSKAGEVLKLLRKKAVAVESSASLGYEKELFRNGVIQHIQETNHQLGSEACYTPDFFKAAKKEYQEKKAIRMKEAQRELDAVGEMIGQELLKASTTNLLQLRGEKEAWNSLVDNLVQTAIRKGYNGEIHHQVKKRLEGDVARECQKRVGDIVQKHVSNHSVSCKTCFQVIKDQNKDLIQAVDVDSVKATIERAQSDAQKRLTLEKRIKKIIHQRSSLYKDPDQILSKVRAGDRSLDASQALTMINSFLKSLEGVEFIAELREKEHRAKAISCLERSVAEEIANVISQKTRSSLSDYLTNQVKLDGHVHQMTEQVKNTLLANQIAILSDDTIRRAVRESFADTIRNVTDSTLLEKFKMAFSFLRGKEYTKSLMETFVTTKHVQP